MKKFLGFVLALATLFSVGTVATACAPSDAIIVQTNAFFAPFEYYDGTEIVGVDVDIMEKVGEKLGKEVVFQDGDFAIIIDVVSQGTMADAGAAGITITDERKEKVDFSIPYYTSVQYVIWEEGNEDFATSECGRARLFEKTKLFSFDRANRTSISTSAAADALISVDLVLGIALGNSANRTCACACAAGNAAVTNYVSL